MVSARAPAEPLTHRRHHRRPAPRLLPRGQEVTEATRLYSSMPGSDTASGASPPAQMPQQNGPKLDQEGPHAWLLSVWGRSHGSTGSDLSQLSDQVGGGGVLWRGAIVSAERTLQFLFRRSRPVLWPQTLVYRGCYEHDMEFHLGRRGDPGVRGGKRHRCDRKGRA